MNKHTNCRFFLFFIFVASFFFLNLITAVVVDRTLAAQDEEDIDSEATIKARRKECATEFVKMIRELNDDKDLVKIDDLLEWSKSDFAEKLLCHVDEDHHFIGSMVLLLDHTKTGYISASQLESFSELKGSVGEGPNHSNHSNHSNSFKYEYSGIFL